MDKFYGVYRYDGELYLAKITVEEYLDLKTQDMKRRFYNLQDYKIPGNLLDKVKTSPESALSEKSAPAVMGAQTPPSSDVLDVSVAQIREIVNTIDKNFFENKIDRTTGKLERRPLLDEIASERSERETEQVPFSMPIPAAVPEQLNFDELTQPELKIGGNVKYGDGTFEVVWVSEEKVKLWDDSTDELFTVSKDELYNVGFSAIMEKSGVLNVISEDKEEKGTISSTFSEPIETKARNFTITDDNLGHGGAKKKYGDNIEAIKTLKIIEFENRDATPKEQEILSKYVGWGGVSDAFDFDNPDWKNEAVELRELLTDEEYAAARKSTMNAFYTSPEVVESIYKTLERFGFDGGRVLEPSCGVGNFFGKMPEDIRKNSQLYGVELDSVSGRIARKLYPSAEISIKSFQDNGFNNDAFDLAVGNIPFGDITAYYDDNKLKIHDYFFAETLDKVKIGGIIAFVTSTGTLDKQDEAFRRSLAEKADLIGAVRLPNNAFKDNAGTEVTSDIIFLQKKEPIELSDGELPEWVKLGCARVHDDGAYEVSINKYFENNPDMILGVLVAGNKLYGRESGTACEPFKVHDPRRAPLKTLLDKALSKLSAVISNAKTSPLKAEMILPDVEIPKELRNFSYFLKDNEIYFKRNNFECVKIELKKAKAETLRAFISIRDDTRELITALKNGVSDKELSGLQEKLKTHYNDFYQKHGLLHGSAKSLFADDVSAPLVLSLEADYDIKTGELKREADIFTKRVIRPVQPVDRADTALEALALSISVYGKVNLDYMKELTRASKEFLIEELKGEIYTDPQTLSYQTASEYLSGDIRRKLKIAEAAAKNDETFVENVAALKRVIPAPLKSGDIDVKLGATWVPPEIYRQFMYETLGTPPTKQTGGLTFMKKIDLRFSGNEYRVENKSEDYNNSVAGGVFGVKTKKGVVKKNGYEILENVLNMRETKVYKPKLDPLHPLVLDEEATKIAQDKANKLREAWADWVFKAPERRRLLVDIYNEKFNSIRPREYDGSSLLFPEMNADITLKEHQKDAIAHAIFGGNALFAHAVGAGKTYEMVAAAMESKRLGLCNKSLFVVPNHLTEQIGDDFLKLYPGANILVATAKDFEKNNRREFTAKIATGQFDAVIIGHSQLVKIPLNPELQKRHINEQINDISAFIQEAKRQRGDRFSIKQMEKTKANLETALANLNEQIAKRQDDVVYFDELGIDKLFIDEAHEFKNLYVNTKLQNVSGISSNNNVQKTSDLFAKCRWLDEKTDGKGLCFATGTPVSNSVTEVHTMMRYLQYDYLKNLGMEHFDSWISTFGEPVSDFQLSPAGNSFKQKTRIANFSNLPELTTMFKQCADVKTADTLNLPVPECELHVINAEPSDLQKAMVQELGRRADEVQNRAVKPEVDNMLKITSDGRKVGLDPRLVNPNFEDNPGSKLNLCVKNVLDIHRDTADERLTQLIFCDLGTPKNSKADILEEYGNFNLYDDIRDKLVSGGVPKKEIAFIHEADSEEKKARLFDKVRKGDVRVLIGSTAKMGAGMNVQDKLCACHDLSIPWRPADMEQRLGRMVRQGNENMKTVI
jgi:N12 class adenine-specific DNA methylase/type I restriction-modification system DNA methylase subunit